MAYRIIKVLIGHYKGHQDNYRDDQNKKKSEECGFCRNLRKEK